MPAGPRIEETVGVQGHRGGAPYGVEEAIWARGGGRSEDYASEVDRGQEEAAHAVATATQTHCAAHAGGGTRSPQVLPELFGAPTRENPGERTGRKRWPPSVDGVGWSARRKTSGENRTGRKRCRFSPASRTSSKAQRDDPFSSAALFGPQGRDKVADRARSALSASARADVS